MFPVHLRPSLVTVGLEKKKEITTTTLCLYALRCASPMQHVALIQPTDSLRLSVEPLHDRDDDVYHKKHEWHHTWKGHEGLLLMRKPRYDVLFLRQAHPQYCVVTGTNYIWIIDDLGKTVKRVTLQCTQDGELSIDEERVAWKHKGSGAVAERFVGVNINGRSARVCFRSCRRDTKLQRYVYGPLSVRWVQLPP